MRRIAGLQIIAVSCLLLTVAPASGAAKIELAPSDIYVFGDSLSDVGNILGLTFGFVPGGDGWQGRFSNGPVWAEHFADGLGLNASTPYLYGGTNYAFGGAQTGWRNDNLDPYLVFLPWLAGIRTGMHAQVIYHAGYRPPNPDGLYVLWGGGNDFIDGQLDPYAPAINMMISIMTLNAVSAARDFVLLDLPPLGYTPRMLDGQGNPSQAMNDRVHIYNDTLELLVNDFVPMVMPDANVTLVKVSSLFDDMLTHPASYGITNFTDPAIDASGDISGYLFWDELHPTAFAHEIIGQYALSSFMNTAASARALVPEPAGVLIVTAGLWFGFHPRRHRSPAR